MRPDERAEPVDGEPMFGLYEHKRSFGAQWVEMTGAHERVIRSCMMLKASTMTVKR